jgi:hypothetical protein
MAIPSHITPKSGSFALPKIHIMAEAKAKHLYL